LGNNTAAGDSYDLTLSSDRGWAALLTASPVAVGSNATATLRVRADVPAGGAGLTDTAVLTATSQTTPTHLAAVTDRTTAPAVCYDFNTSGAVDIGDIMRVVRRWGATPGDGSGLYDPMYDLVYDEVIDVDDVMAAVTEWRRSCQGGDWRLESMD